MSVEGVGFVCGWCGEHVGREAVFVSSRGGVYCSRRHAALRGRWDWLEDARVYLARSEWERCYDELVAIARLGGA